MKQLLEDIEGMCLFHIEYNKTHPEVWIPYKMFETLNDGVAQQRGYKHVKKYRLISYIFSGIGVPVAFYPYEGSHLQVLPEGSFVHHTKMVANYKLNRLFQEKDRLHPLAHLLITSFVDSKKDLNSNDIAFINEIYPEYFSD